MPSLIHRILQLLFVLQCMASYSSEVPRPIIFRLSRELETVPFAPSPTLIGPSDSTTAKHLSDLLAIAPMQPLVHQFPKEPAVGTISSRSETNHTEGLKRHGLHLYYTIQPDDFKERTPQEIINKLLSNPLVDFAELEPIVLPAESDLAAPPPPSFVPA